VTNNASGPGRRSQAEAARTRERVLARAERLFSQRGYRGVSLRELAEACGVRPFTIQHHFGSKLGLYDAVLRRWDEDVLARVSERLAGQLEFPVLVEQIVDDLFDLLLAKRAWVALNVRAELGEGLPKGHALGDRSWITLMQRELGRRRIATGRFDLRLLLITLEGVLNNHVLARAHYRRLFGRDVSDTRLKRRTKAHIRDVILSLLGVGADASSPTSAATSSSGKVRDD
jgi:AcrR family transcriptional regulator